MKQQGFTIKGAIKIIPNTFLVSGGLWSVASNWSLGVVPFGNQYVVIASNCTINSSIGSFAGTLVVNAGINLAVVFPFSNLSSVYIKRLIVDGVLTCNANNIYINGYIGGVGTINGSNALRTLNTFVKEVNLTASISPFSGFTDISQVNNLGGLNAALIMGATIFLSRKTTFNGNVSVDRCGGSPFQFIETGVQNSEKKVIITGTFNTYGSVSSGFDVLELRQGLNIGVPPSTSVGHMYGNVLLLTVSSTISHNVGSINAEIFFNSIIISNAVTITITASSTARFLKFNSITGIGSAILAVSANTNITVLAAQGLMATGTLTCASSSLIEYTKAAGSGNQDVKNTTYGHLTITNGLGTHQKVLLGNTTVNGNLIVNNATLNRNGFTLTVVGSTSLISGGVII